MKPKGQNMLTNWEHNQARQFLARKLVKQLAANLADDKVLMVSQAQARVRAAQIELDEAVREGLKGILI